MFLINVESFKLFFHCISFLFQCRFGFYLLEVCMEKVGFVCVITINLLRVRYFYTLTPCDVHCAEHTYARNLNSHVN